MQGVDGQRFRPVEPVETRCGGMVLRLEAGPRGGEQRRPRRVLVLLFDLHIVFVLARSWHGQIDIPGRDMHLGKGLKF